MHNEVWNDHLNPVAFLERSSFVYPDKPAVVYGNLTYTYAQLHERVNRLAGALRNAGVVKGDRVAFIVPNIPAMLEGHFGPMAIGAVLVAVNTRLATREVEHIINHSGAKIIVFDSEYASTIRDLKDKLPNVTLLVQVVDTSPHADDIPGPDYETFLASAPEGQHREQLDSELDTIAINYTSGTTGIPKGVQYHARGAYLAAMGEIIESGLNWRSKYLWTLPMFHCNGWCFTWAVTGIGGTHICLRRVDPIDILRLITEQGVTHMCGAPTVLISMYSSPAAEGQDLHGLTIVTAGAPPAPVVLRAMESMGATVLHAYGLTETYGPHTMCEPQLEWDSYSPTEMALAKSRQGVPYIQAHTGMRVVDERMQDVPLDGQTLGEVAMRGNNVMSGYYNDIENTNKSFAGGWFHSGDLAVWHSNGYIELKDRAKDIIISGGENISSQEVEKTIMEHPGVLEVSVIGVPDDKWGEVPKAFVVSRDGASITADEVISFCQDRIARFKAPKHVTFGNLPKTATGKVQKYILRNQEWGNQQTRIQGPGAK
jgi:fatty-acyl-CoA synthase